jgi:hypothetical protein
MSIQLIVVGLLGGAFALSANLVAFAMIEQINEKAPEGEKVHWFFWGTEIKKRHQTLYPDSKLVPVINTLAWLMVASFLVGSWFVLH